MERRKKIIIAIVILLLLAALVVLYILSRQGPAGTSFVEDIVDTVVSRPLGGGLNTSVTTETNTAPPPVTEPEPEAPPAQPAKPDERGNLRRVASAFAERYGSFSNTTDFENLLDLKAFMSQSYAAQADAYVAEARAKGGTSAEYSGMTTRSISNELVSFNESAGTAEVVVQTQRQEITGSGESVYYQSISVKFVKEEGLWKVNAAAWRPKGS